MLACETKVDGASRRPSAMLWAIAAGRLKKFHASQVRHASESEKLVSSASSAPTFPWTFTSQGSYDDETKPKRRTWGRSSRAKAKAREAKEETGGSRRKIVASSVPQHVRDAPSAENVKRPLPDAPEDELDIDRLLEDITYLPPGQPGPVSFREQRASHERSDGARAARVYCLVCGGRVLQHSVLCEEILEDPKAWKKILKPSKFTVKNVQKGVEVSYRKLNEKQKVAMSAAKTVELESWLGHKVARAACPSIAEDQCMRMRWLCTFNSAGDEPAAKGQVKAKVRIVVLGFSDPSLLERTTAKPGNVPDEQDVTAQHGKCPKVEDLGWRRQNSLFTGQAPERLRPLCAKPLPELAEAMKLSEGQMIELLGSAYGLTSSPREWLDDFASTLRKFGAQQSKCDPCLWTVVDGDGVVRGLLGVHVDDVLFSGDEGSSVWTTFLHDLHESYKWALWEAENFLRCGLRLQQFADDSVLLGHSPLSEEEMSQARAILGSAQWRVTQSGPRHAAKLSYLQSFLATRHFSAIDQVNKLV